MAMVLGNTSIRVKWIQGNPCKPATGNQLIVQMSIKDLISGQTKWQAADPDIRIQAVGDITDPDILKQLIEEDPEERVRCAAISQLQDYDQLVALSGQTDAMGHAARLQYCHLLASNSDLAHSQAAVGRLNETLLLKEIALSNNPPELINVAMNRIDDEEHLVDIACQAGTTIVRQAAADRVASVGALEMLQQKAKHRDKLVLNIAKTRLRAIQQELTEKKQLLNDASEAATEMHQLARSVGHPSFERTFNYLESKWNTLECRFQELRSDDDQQSLTTIRDRFETSRKICFEQIETVLREEEDHKNTLIQAGQIVEQLNSTLNDLHKSCDALADLQQPADEIRQKWHHLLQDKLTPELSEEYYRALNKLEFLLDAQKRWSHLRDQLPKTGESIAKQLKRDIDDLHWPEGFPPPTDLTSTRQLLEKSTIDQGSQMDERQKARQEALRKLGELDEAIKAGHIKHANRLMREADQLVAQSPRSMSERLQRLSKELHELKDWQGYATSPKREELCEKAENLINLQLHPREKADRIRELHKQWKELGDSHGDQKRWRRFKQASDAAYEPCKEYFQKQTEERKQRLQERTQICEQLEDFDKHNNWESANWKAVSEIISTARRQWRLLEPIDHAHRKSVQPRFYKILDALQARLKVEWDRNRDIKADLISQAEKVVANEELSNAIEQTIALQKQWKQVGVTDRKVDQKLWKKFRRACDEVFDRKNEQRTSERKLEEKNSTLAESLCKTMEDLAASSSTDHQLSRSELARFKSEFSQIDLAHRFRKKINDRFNKASEHYKKAIELQAQRQRGLVIDELAKLAGLCEQLESHDGDAESFDRLKTDLEQQWSTSIPLPSDIKPRIEQRWSSATAMTGSSNDDLEKVRVENGEAARLICIKLELLAGIESPPEDQEMRMEYQVSRLKREFSERQKETRSHEEQLRALQIDWYCLGPIPSKQLEGLKQRFRSATSKE
jgi:hypothetical protein